MAGTVIRVGDGGRGATAEDRFVIAASHCLPDLPPAHPAAFTEERTYRDFLGPLGGSCDVWAECVFVDPVADLAVFREPDNQELSDKADAYDRLIEAATPFTVGKLRFHRSRHRLPDGEIFSGPRKAVSDALMLSLDGRVVYMSGFEYRSGALG